MLTIIYLTELLQGPNKPVCQKSFQQYLEYMYIFHKISLVLLLWSAKSPHSHAANWGFYKILVHTQYYFICLTWLRWWCFWYLFYRWRIWGLKSHMTCTILSNDQLSLVNKSLSPDTHPYSSSYTILRASCSKTDHKYVLFHLKGDEVTIFISYYLQLRSSVFWITKNN